MSSSPDKKCACPTCGSGDDDGEEGFNPFGMGGTLDYHMDCDVTEDEMTKRVADAITMGGKFGGTTPGGMVSELGLLQAPKLTWQDFIRFVKARKKAQDTQKNNWNNPKRKSLFSGIYAPTKRDYTMTVLVAYDCSGSMSNEAIAYGLSQIKALDGKADAWVVPWDACAFWDSKQYLQKTDTKSLGTIKRVGGGGTVLAPVFNEYQKEIGEVDLIIIISDMYIADTAEVQNIKLAKGTDVVWLNVHGDPHFKYPFGKAFKLNND